MVVVWASGSLEAGGGHEQRKNAGARRSDFERQSALTLGGYARKVNGRS